MSVMVTLIFFYLNVIKKNNIAAVSFHPTTISCAYIVENGIEYIMSDLYIQFMFMFVFFLFLTQRNKLLYSSHQMPSSSPHPLSVVGTDKSPFVSSIEIHVRFVYQYMYCSILLT